MVSSLFWYSSTITQWQTAHNNLEQGASNGPLWKRLRCFLLRSISWILIDSLNIFKIPVHLGITYYVWKWFAVLRIWIHCSGSVSVTERLTKFLVFAPESWCCYSDIRAAAEAVMRRCHEDEQDDLGSAHPHLRCLGPHGRRGLCQVE